MRPWNESAQVAGTTYFQRKLKFSFGIRKECTFVVCVLVTLKATIWGSLGNLIKTWNSFERGCWQKVSRTSIPTAPHKRRHQIQACLHKYVNVGHKREKTRTWPATELLSSTRGGFSVLPWQSQSSYCAPFSVCCLAETCFLDHFRPRNVACVPRTVIAPTTFAAVSALSTWPQAHLNDRVLVLTWRSVRIFGGCCSSRKARVAAWTTWQNTTSKLMLETQHRRQSSFLLLC